MLSCEQIPCLLQEILYNFGVARATKRSDFDRCVHIVVFISHGGTFLLALFQKTLCDARHSELFGNIILRSSVKLAFT